MDQGAREIERAVRAGDLSRVHELDALLRRDPAFVWTALEGYPTRGLPAESLVDDRWIVRTVDCVETLLGRSWVTTVQRKVDLFHGGGAVERRLCPRHGLEAGLAQHLLACLDQKGRPSTPQLRAPDSLFPSR